MQAMLHTYFALITNWSLTVVVGWALCWLCYRGYQVLSKPADVLINLLGIETPEKPVISLANISTHTITLHWKAGDPDLPKPSFITHHLHVNNNLIGEVFVHEPILQLENLLPDQSYSLRVITTTPGGFATPSDPIRVQTLPITLDDGLNDRENDASDVPSRTTPTVRSVRAGSDAMGPTTVAPSMSREHSNSITQTQSRRTNAGRRAAVGLVHSDNQDEPNSALLDELRNQYARIEDEKDRVLKQIMDEEEEFQQAQVTQAQERERLRKDQSEREGVTKKSKQEVSKLEQAEKIARTNKTNAEKRLRQKRQDREKLQNDTTKWKKQAATLNAEIAGFEDQKLSHRRDVDEQISTLKITNKEQTDAIQALEDTIQSQKHNIRDLEAEPVNEMPESNVNEHVELDRDWQTRLMELQNGYNRAWQAMEEAKRHHQVAQSSVAYWERMRNEQPQMFTASPHIEVAIHRQQSQRRNRSSSMRNELNTQAPAFEPAASQVAARAFVTAQTATTMPPAYTSVPSFFSMGNGAVIGLAPSETPMTPGGDIDQLTGGGPASPNAGNFLPSDLLSDDMEPSRFEPSFVQQIVVPKPTPVMRSPSMALPLPGLGALQTIISQSNRDPSSPVSGPSAPQSEFASPQVSNPQLTSYPPGSVEAGKADSDHRSIRSATGSNRAVSNSSNQVPNGSRFNAIFGFHRTRGKTFSDEGPSLGSLRSSETQSLPRDAFDAINGHRSHGSQSGHSWMGMGLHRNATAAGAESAWPARKGRFGNMFGSKTDTWPTMALGDKPPSPRAPSINSSETSLLPKPNAAIVGQFGWPVAGDGFGQRHSPLSTDWAASTVTPWSRHPSRRPSGQHNVSFGTIGESTFENRPHSEVYTTDKAYESPKQAPIGTRPTTSSSVKAAADAAAALNPAATTFSFGMPGSGNSNSKIDKPSEENKEPGAIKESRRKRKEKNKRQEAAEAIEFTDSFSAGRDFAQIPSITTNGQHSYSSSIDNKDARSFSTLADTLSEPRSSLERNLTSTTNGDSTSIDPPNSATRESFMQRLTRKSSAGIFSLTSLTKSATEKSSSRFAKKDRIGPSTPTVPAAQESTFHDTDETDDETSRSYLSLATPTGKSSVDSEKGSPFLGSAGVTPTGRPSNEKQRSGFSFRNFTGTLKKKDRGVVTNGGASASETGEDDED